MLSLNCTEISNDNALAVRGKDELYREAILQSAKFNKKFISDRKMRIPLVDSQTRIAQSNCTLWNIEYLKQRPKSSTQVIRYNVKCWKKTRRSLFDSTPKTEPSLDLSSEATNSAEVGSEHQEPVKRSPPVEVHPWYEDSDNDFENEAEKVPNKKNKNRKKGKSEDKLLYCDKCGAKYKTKQGLNYHYLNFHQVSSMTPINNNFDESTTNSISGSIYEDGNSSSMPPANH